MIVAFFRLLSQESDDVFEIEALLNLEARIDYEDVPVDDSQLREILAQNFLAQQEFEEVPELMQMDNEISNYCPIQRPTPRAFICRFSESRKLKD